MKRKPLPKQMVCKFPQRPRVPEGREAGLDGREGLSPKHLPLTGRLGDVLVRHGVCRLRFDSHDEDQRRHQSAQLLGSWCQDAYNLAEPSGVCEGHLRYEEEESRKLKGLDLQWRITLDSHDARNGYLLSTGAAGKNKRDIMY
jgi:hypothetical protein